jgi:hypothetical protein
MKSLSRDAIIVDGIRYCHPNFLRMGMYLELSRPNGDVKRWEKVFLRLKILNKEYPIDNYKDSFETKPMRKASVNIEKYGIENMFEIAEKTIKHLAGYQHVFFGVYAFTQYHNLLRNLKKEKRIESKLGEAFYAPAVLSENPEKTIRILREALEYEATEEQLELLSKIKVEEHDAIGEVIPRHCQMKIGSLIVLYVYEPIACHNYNEVILDGMKIRIATIDTIMSFYLALIYADKNYYEFIFGAYLYRQTLL